MQVSLTRLYLGTWGLGDSLTYFPYLCSVMRILILFILSISNLLTCSLVDSVTQSLVDSEHQFHLLQVSIADSLYKSYLPQHNFEEVKAAVDFFELDIDETDDILLIYNCARAHYYHAVGLTERDDIIGACEHISELWS